MEEKILIENGNGAYLVKRDIGLWQIVIEKGYEGVGLYTYSDGVFTQYIPPPIYEIY